MTKKAKILWIVFAAIFVAGVAYLAYYLSNQSSSDEVEIYDNWDITFDPKDKNPYGTFVIKELLDSLVLGENFEEIDDQEQVKLDSNDIFLFIGHQMHLSDASRDSLITQVSKGATAMLILESLNQEFIDLLTYEDIDGFHSDSIVTLGFEHATLKNKKYDLIYMEEKKMSVYPWTHFSADNIFHKTAKILGKDEQGNINFIRFKLGEGYMFIHTSPIAFTNLNVLREDGFLYTEAVFSHLPPGNIEYHSYARFQTKNDTEEGGDGGGGSDKKKSPLEFILAQPSLKWAFFVLVSMLLITLLFKSKRRRRSVKLIEKKVNTTVGHIDTVATIFMQQKQHQKLIAIKERNFYQFVQNHYFLTIKGEGDKFNKRLSEKSGIDIIKIENILNSFAQSKGYANQTILHEVHKRIDYFYTNCSTYNQSSADSKRFTKEYTVKTKLLLPLLAMGIGLLKIILGLLLLTGSYSIGILVIMIGLAGLIYSFFNLNKVIARIKNEVLTVEGKPPISIELRALKKIYIEGEVLYLEDFNAFVELNLNKMTNKDRSFFEGLAAKYHKTN